MGTVTKISEVSGSVGNSGWCLCYCGSLCAAHATCVSVKKKKSTNTQLYLLFELLTHASFFNFALLPVNGELKKTHFLTNQQSVYTWDYYLYMLIASWQCTGVCLHIS